MHWPWGAVDFAELKAAESKTDSALHVVVLRHNVAISRGASYDDSSSQQDDENELRKGRASDRRHTASPCGEDPLEGVSGTSTLHSMPIWKVFS